MEGHGPTNKEKRLSPEKAQERMRREVDATGRRVFSRRQKENGPVLTVAQIRSWFSTFKAKISGGSARTDPLDGFVNAMAVGAMRRDLGLGA